jgi:hypothetical protein
MEKHTYGSKRQSLVSENMFSMRLFIKILVKLRQFSETTPNVTLNFHRDGHLQRGEIPPGTGR